MCTNLRNDRKCESELVRHNVPGSNNCGANNDIHIVQSHSSFNNNNKQNNYFHIFQFVK